MTFIIKASGLTKTFGSHIAVNQLTFEVREGEVLGLLGPNGAGKTTTIRMLACLISPTEGSAMVAGNRIDENSLAVRQTVGILTETPSLYERLTAKENLDFFAKAYNLLDNTKRFDRIKELLVFFSLWKRRNDKVGTFSKGMKQKLAIARALVHKPSILFLDEPTAGLDPESSKEVRDLMKTLSRQEKYTILLCTHHLKDAEQLCDRVMIINNGKSVITGTLDELRTRVEGQLAIQVVLKKINSKIVEAAKTVNGVQRVDVDKSASMLKVYADDVELSTPLVVKNIVDSQGLILSVNVLRPSLEEVYLKLIKGDLK